MNENLLAHAESIFKLSLVAIEKRRLNLRLMEHRIQKARERITRDEYEMVRAYERAVERETGLTYDEAVQIELVTDIPTLRHAVAPEITEFEKMYASGKYVPHVP